MRSTKYIGPFDAYLNMVTMLLRRQSGSAQANLMSGASGHNFSLRVLQCPHVTFKDREHLLRSSQEEQNIEI